MKQHIIPSSCSSTTIYPPGGLRARAGACAKAAAAGFSRCWFPASHVVHRLNISISSDFALCRWCPHSNCSCRQQRRAWPSATPHSSGSGDCIFRARVSGAPQHKPHRKTPKQFMLYPPPRVSRSLASGVHVLRAPVCLGGRDASARLARLVREELEAQTWGALPRVLSHVLNTRYVLCFGSSLSC